MLENSASATKAVGELIKIAGNSEEANQAGKEIGKAAVTISKAINNCLLPLAAINYAFDKARLYFDSDFKEELGEKLSDIPQENVTEPAASIAGPAIQSLAFAHEEKELKELYLNLLASAMNSEKNNSVHPSFVEIIRQMSPFEALILKHLKNNCESENVLFRQKVHGYVPYCDTDFISDQWSRMCDSINQECNFDHQVYYQNLIRLQILTEEIDAESNYTPEGQDTHWYEARVETYIETSVYFSDFGKQFLDICV